MAAGSVSRTAAGGSGANHASRPRGREGAGAEGRTSGMGLFLNPPPPYSRGRGGGGGPRGGFFFFFPPPSPWRGGGGGGGGPGRGDLLRLATLLHKSPRHES